MHHTTDLNESQRGSEGELAETGTFGILPTSDEAWLIRDEGFQPDREHDLESIFAVANGRFGVRGSLAEGMSLSAPATYAAGFYSHPSAGTNAEPAILPNWTLLRAHSDGEAVSLTGGRILRHVRTLDMRQGIQWREWLHEDAAGRVIWILGIRGASLADPRLLFQGAAMESHNFVGPFTIEAGMERNPFDAAMSLQVIATGADRSVLVVRYHPQHHVAAAGEWTRILASTGEILPSQVVSSDKGFLRQWNLKVGVGQSMRFERITSFAVSESDPAPTDAVQQALNTAEEAGFGSVVAEHAAAWEKRWADADMEIDGDTLAQRRLRFAMYHLLSAAPVDAAVSIGARSLTGPGYKGHVFWDTEIFMLPFYLSAAPEAAKPLLMYRYRTLEASRHLARQMGYAGALYPWESADSGEDETPEFYLSPTGAFIPILCGIQEHHISADVAWAVARYWDATADRDFFLHFGAEIILETARFWASRCEPGEDGRWHIRRIMGPDEFHPSVDDNAYTNHMARWNLRYAADTADWMAHSHPGDWQALQERINVSPSELLDWRLRAEAMADGCDPATGLIEQFSGYFELAAKGHDQELRLAPALGEEYRGSMIKQPDVMLLFQLFAGRYPDSVVGANFDYYEPRTVHGSSLSPATEALIAARLGRMAVARRLYARAGDVDLATNVGNASGGVHIAAMGGLWQATMMGFAGKGVFSDGLEFRPHLPPEWKNLRFRTRWRGRSLAVQIGDQGRTLEAELLDGDDIRVRFRDQVVELKRKEGPRSAKLRSPFPAASKRARP